MRRFALTLFVLATTACASTGGVPRPFPTPGGWNSPPLEASSPAATAAQGAYAIAGTALSFRGVPYRNGGSDPSGFDCSGLVWYVFAQHGLRVPRTVDEQYRAGTPIDRSSVDAGDLVFFNTKGAGATHVGISIGGDEFVHAPNSTGEVRVDRLGTNYWMGRFVGARRMN
jgi:cell wall-associated NlpC family hydrolase